MKNIEKTARNIAFYGFIGFLMVLALYERIETHRFYESYGINQEIIQKFSEPNAGIYSVNIGDRNLWFTLDSSYLEIYLVYKPGNMRSWVINLDEELRNDVRIQAIQ